MLHTEGKKLYYNGVIVKLNDKDEYCDITKEEVISLIERRRVHKGIKITQTKVQEVDIDNNWNCDVSLREYKKKLCTVSGYFLIILSKDSHKPKNIMAKLPLWAMVRSKVMALVVKILNVEISSSKSPYFCEAKIFF